MNSAVQLHCGFLSMLISLGHSCQTRFIIDTMGEAANRRMPFDFNITTRAALLRALDTDGASLRQSAEQARVFMEPREQREGIEIGGMYFWHDYPLDEAKLRLRADWRQDLGRVSEKYAALWQRFAALSRSEEPKTFFLSNTQHNLGQFAGGDADFDRKFGLGREAFDQISQAFDAFGARNYRLLVLSRSIREFEEMIDVADPRLVPRFAGRLSLRPDPDILSQIFADAKPLPMDVFGSYDSDKHVGPGPRGSGIIYRVEQGMEKPEGALWATHVGLTASFEGRDRVFGATLEGRNLSFADGTRWSRN
jgi:hypothetical protein